MAAGSFLVAGYVFGIGFELQVVERQLADGAEETDPQNRFTCAEWDAQHLTLFAPRKRAGERADDPELGRVAR